MPAHWPWTQLLRFVLADESVVVSGPDRAQPTRLLPELGGTVPEGGGEIARIETFEAVASTLRRATAARPTV